MIRNTLLVLFISFGSFVFSQQYSRVKINTDIEGLKQLSELGLPVDHGTYKLNTFFISDFSEYDIQKLIDNNFSYEILIADVQKYYVDQNLKPAAPAEKNVGCSNGSSVFNPAVPANFNYGSMGGYLTYQEMLDNLDAMAAQYPTLITARAPISTFLTIENRPIYHVKISDNALTDETEPEVLQTAIHHAREPMSMSQTIFYMWYLLENYNTNDEVKYLVDNTEIFFVPCINPDGYIYNETTDPAGGGMHRKNRRDIGTTNKGVDLNRNYSYGWGTTGVSFNPNDDTYPGTGAFSEAETQAMQWLVQNHTFITALNSHTYGNTLLYPVGTTTAEFADHNDYFVDLSNHMVALNGYLAQKSSSLYPASGDSDDYMYKVDIGIGLKDTMFVMTPEVGSDFWPSQADIFSTCQDMVFTNLINSHITHIYVVVDDTDPSTVETMTGNFNHSSFRLGLQDGPVTVSIEPLLNIQSVGAPVIETLLLRESQTGSISYILNPAIAFGDEIKYVLKTDNGLWTKRDTIIKTFGALTLQFTDDASSNANWTGNWGTTLSTYVSPSSSFTESNTGNYPNNTNKTYELNQSIDLTNVFAAGVSYFAKWEIETDFDYCQFQVSTDNGISWIGQCGNYTVIGNSANGSVQPDLEPVYEGTQSSWVLEEINLSDYIGQIINVRFQLESDGGVRQDGFYYDDFKIAYNTNPLGLDENSFVALTSPNPANTYAYVSFSKVITNGKVELFDQNGKLVQSHLITEQTNKVLLNTETLLQGIYTVHVTDYNTVSKPVKLVVVH
jgi:carboxypeptidase T